jgi:hypothetical protein
MSERTSVDTPPHGWPLVTVAVVSSVLGVALRLMPRSALWLDEALSVNIASLPLGDIPSALERDGHPPLYYFLLHFWLELGSSDWWVRTLSAVVSVLGMPLAYLAGVRISRRKSAGGLGARRLGLIAVALWALMPFAVRYGSETRMYALVSTLVLAGYLLVDNMLGTQRPGTGVTATSPWPSAVGILAITAALLYTHYWALWLLAATGLLVIAVLVRAVSSDLRRRAWMTLGAMAAGGLLYLPWVPTMLFQAENTGTPWGEVFRPATIVVVTITDFVGGGFGELQIMSYLLFSAIAVAVFGALRARAGRDVVEITAVPQARVIPEVAVVLGTLMIGWAAAAVSGSTYASRYSAVVAPMFALAVAGGLAMIRTRVGTAVAVGVVCAALLTGSVLEVVSDRTQADIIADAIVSDLAANGLSGEDLAGDVASGDGSPRAVVVTCPDQLGPATSRALANRGSEIQVLPYPESGEDPRFVNWVDYAERNEASDPIAYAEDLHRSLAPDATVYLVANPGYLTFEGKCEALATALGSAGGVTEVQVVADPENHFEPMGLWVTRPAA